MSDRNPIPPAECFDDESDYGISNLVPPCCGYCGEVLMCGIIDEMQVHLRETCPVMATIDESNAINEYNAIAGPPTTPIKANSRGGEYGRADQKWNDVELADLWQLDAQTPEGITKNATITEHFPERSKGAVRLRLKRLRAEKDDEDAELDTEVELGVGVGDGDEAGAESEAEAVTPKRTPVPRKRFAQAIQTPTKPAEESPTKFKSSVKGKGQVVFRTNLKGKTPLDISYTTPTPPQRYPGEYEVAKAIFPVIAVDRSPPPLRTLAMKTLFGRITTTMAAAFHTFPIILAAEAEDMHLSKPSHLHTSPYAAQYHRSELHKYSREYLQELDGQLSVFQASDAVPDSEKERVWCELMTYYLNLCGVEREVVKKEMVSFGHIVGKWEGEIGGSFN